MGRRTVWWRALAAVGAALCATAGLPAQAAAAGTPAPYAFAEDATRVEGMPSTTGAVRLAPGKTYRSSIREGGKLYYRLELGNGANAYVSATAVPRMGTAVASAEGVKVTVQDVNGHRCSSETARFGPTGSPRPVTAWASRQIGRDPYMCQEAGTYYVLVERVGTVASSQGTQDTRSSQGLQGSQQSQESRESQESSGEAWGLELGYVLEPLLKQTGSTSAPEVGNSTSPAAVTGDAKRRRGGTSFTTASAVAQGVWEETDGIRAGQTLYYRVPVHWGQQLYATAELGGSGSGDDGYVGNALVMSLYNPVRGFVDDATAGYDGRQRSADLDRIPPVRYDNRFARDDRMSGMRFAGWYYLAVHLGAPVAERFGEGPFGLTLRVGVAGSAAEGPGYLGTSEPAGVFEITAADQEAAESGSVGGATGAGEESGGSAGSGTAEASDGARGIGDDHTVMKLVAVAGIGTGSLLVLGLGVWTVAARRRTGVGAAGQGVAVKGPGHGAPRG
ncbi:hypothetical protein [Streptomyces bluensis]|uniref:hypothetical protein n=1 Tax=Streptomyces bluensis TaxID=33897 RepID=UPI00198B97F5|nr:hypothetical protein [Streptomyces bluensis]GGZ83969.1 hypothetical protein GCM10010344_58970 [Streptomyces bluensis]